MLSRWRKIGTEVLEVHGVFARVQGDRRTIASRTLVSGCEISLKKPLGVCTECIYQFKAKSGSRVTILGEAKPSVTNGAGGGHEIPL